MRSRELLVLFMLVLAGSLASDMISSEKTSLADNRTQIRFQDHILNVEIADTPEERRRGLMFREKLEKNNGMLFVYKDEGYRSFWMKNTLIPLDIIFLDSDLQVINIEKANPEPNTSDENLASYRSLRPAKYVLELNQNRSKEIGLERGSKINLMP